MGNTNSIIKKKHIFKKPQEGNYVIKVDDLQIDRIQQQHHIFKGFCNTNFSSPISKDLARGIKVLDVGSGPGTWIFDMSSEFPNSNFTGVEIQSFMLPTIHPSNTRFVYSDVLKGLPFDANSFDYIHMRFMILCFTESQYQQVVKNLVDLLKPNGFIELCETELQFYNMGPIAKKFNDALFKLMIMRSMNPYLNHRLQEFLKNTGLQQIEQKDIMIPLSALDGKLGSLMGENVINVVTGLKGSLTKIMNISDSEMDELIGQLITEIKSIKMYMRYTRIYGRKISFPNMNLRKFRTY